MNFREAVNSILAKAQGDIDVTLGDEALTKAADAMGESREITDAWQEGKKHTAISGDVPTGPALAAVGSNTQRMNATYSSNASQSGTEADAQQLLGQLGLMQSTMKAQGRAIESLIESHKANNALIVALLKAEPEPTVKAEDDDKDDVTEKAKSQSATFLAQGQTLLNRANALRKAADDMDEDDDKDDMKKAKAKARALKKAAVVAFSKARRYAYIAADGALKKSVTDAALKGEVDFMEDEELDKAESVSEEDIDKSMTAKTVAAPAAKADDKGNQVDREDPTDGNQAAAAAKGEINALAAQLGVMQTSLHGLLDMVSGQSKGPVVKAQVTTENPESYSERIMRAQDAGALTSGEAVLAESVAHMIDAVAKGQLDKTVMQARLKNAPAAVKTLYADLAA